MGSPTEPDGYACVVMSYRDEEGLVEAVRSVLAQSIPIEVVVVNSGGGDPAGRLAAAELDVPVVHFEERLFPGAARNVGIAHTRSRYVQFMAADCLAEPGHAAARLATHRDGAAAVASVMTNAYPWSLSAYASYLLLHRRRMPDTPAALRAYDGASYDRRVLERLGPFREDLRAAEDTEYFARLPAGSDVRHAPGARLAHRYPTTVWALVRDQYARGRRRATTEGMLREAGMRGRIALGALRNVPACMRQSLRTSDPRERRRLIAAWPLLVPGAVAYAVGALAAGTSGESTKARAGGTARRRSPRSSVR